VSAFGDGVRAGLCFNAGFAAVLWLLFAPLQASAGDEGAFLARVNQVRAEHKLIALEPSAELARVARAHAEDMARRGYLAHENPEGQNPLERTQAAGVAGFRLLAENIGASTIAGDRLESIVAEWLRSRDHRENLLNPAFNTSGLAIVEAPDGRTIVVELYATWPR
jgi:uncharacterized protein YkwD